MKALGQAGLDFIASKYKELKELVGKKADKSEIKTKLSELTGDSTHRTVTDTEKTKWNNKVDKVSGKGLSTNDYDNTARALVEAIPTNPKYTDTVTEVVDNLTTSDSTKALSAKQGKTLNDSLSGKADKSNIGRCKTKGYGSASAWTSASSSRDLEDWIGDFDKRTRELKDNSGGVRYLESFEEKNQDGQMTKTWSKIKIGNIMILIYTGKGNVRFLCDSLRLRDDEKPKNAVMTTVVGYTSDGSVYNCYFVLSESGRVYQQNVPSSAYVGSFVWAYECA